MERKKLIDFIVLYIFEHTNNTLYKSTSFDDRWLPALTAALGIVFGNGA